MPNTFYTYEYIAPSECLGDSLNKIRNNDFNASNAIGDLETRIVAVSSDLKSRIDLKEDEFTVLPVLSGGTGATTAANARTNLGLGTLATLNTIANANVIAGAGIEGTKISSNFGSQQVYSNGNFTTASYMWANGLVYAGNNKVQIGGGGLGGDTAGYINFNVPGYGIVRYWGGWSWNDGLGTRVGVATNGDMYVGGTARLGALVTAGYKSFLIDHPVKPNYTLLHICPESPTPDLIYRGVVKLKAGRAKINIDATYNMTPGTINALANNLVVTSLQNQDSFNRLKPTPVVNGEFEILCEDLNSTDNVSWVVIGTRKDIPLPKIENPKL